MLSATAPSPLDDDPAGRIARLSRASTLYVEEGSAMITGTKAHQEFFGFVPAGAFNLLRLRFSR